MSDFISRIRHLLMIATLGWTLPGFAADPPPPNIIFFLVDDMGWMDCSVYGSEYYETPNIERLAQMGMRFTNAYAVNPLCSPTRASILTGHYPARYHLTTPAGHLPPNPDVDLVPASAAPWKKVIDAKSRTFLPLEAYTIAEAMKKTGYTTAHIGKWHLGHEAYWPKMQGFDVNIAGGHYPGPPSFFSPYKIKTLPDGPEHEYITDRLTEEALRYLEANRDTAFFLNMWQYAVHAPYQGKLEKIKKYTDKTDPRGQQKSPIMGAMIESMDESLRRILDKLEELKIADRTIIVFFSDNGGNMYDLLDEDGLTPTNNYPLKYGKGNIYEGGVRVPCIVVWPDQIEKGSVSEEIIGSIDFFPTLLQMAGMPASQIPQTDGQSLVQVLKKGKPLKRKRLFLDFAHYTPATNNYPTHAVRSGKWKLMRVYGEGPDQSPDLRLYDLESDIGETENLAARFPGLVKKLQKQLDLHIREVGDFIPANNPAYDPQAESRMYKRRLFPLEKYPSY